MEELIQTRYRLKAKLTRIEKFTQSYDITTGKVQDINVRLDLLSEIWSEFNKVQSEIEFTCKKKDVDTEELEQEEFENRILSVKSSLLSLTDQNNGGTQSTVTSNSTCPPSQIKLPFIDLPVFHGDYLQWSSFYDLFSSVIHSNAALTPAQKLHYLKSSLRGDASKLLNSITTTNANYNEAMKILSDRYANKRQIISSHLKTLFSQPKLDCESASELRKILDVTIENVRGLHVLGLPTSHWDCLLVFLVVERVDSDTRRQWELSTSNSDCPTFNQLKEFLETRCRALEAAGLSNVKPVTKVIAKRQPKHAGSVSTSTYHTISASCEKCQSEHMISKCEQFLGLSVRERSEFVKSKALCFNCLKSGHYTNQCKSSLCRKCHKPHNTLLHYEDTRVNTHVISSNMNSSQVLLATAIVKLQDSIGQQQLCRALLDSGSQASFISEACVQRLNLKRHRAFVGVNGLAMSAACVSKGTVQLRLSSVTTNYSCMLQALILPKVTSKLPFNHIDTAKWTHINNLKLADPNFYVPSDIDILIGADVFPELTQVGKIVGPKGSPVAQNTNLGWILSGCFKSTIHPTVPSPNTFHMLLDISDQLKQFWELEEIPQQQFLTTTEKECENHFESTHTRDETGRFVVRLPFKDNISLGNSREIATNRLLQVEKRLARQPDMRQSYVKFMTEYLELGHMTLVTNEKCGSSAYYLPHHAVVKETSSTTKLRVVFDGTAKPLSGSSINDKLLVGPTVQDDLVTILLRFRMYNIAFTANITKMYRQILVHPDDRDYQRILWRVSPRESIQNYRLNTVTYGTSSAPYLATRCLQQLAHDGQIEFPLGSLTLKRDFYVDDLMSGSDSLTDALQVQSQLIKLLQSGGFELRKWSSNELKLLESLPLNLREDQLSYQLNSDGMVKTLGLYWHPADDCFTFRVNTNPKLATINKRTILSEISRLFDPLGWLAPIVLSVKLIIQKLWLLGVSWDEALPSDLIKTWNVFRDELPMIENIRLNRKVICDSNYKQYQLHGFSDASERAYGTVIYLRSINGNNKVCVNLICAKSKVAPIKQISLPRLELCGAVLLARLMKKVQNVLEINSDSVFLWTDSMVVLSWLSSHASRWKTFIANRVSEIQELIPRQHWNHVKSADNPADCLSRGLTPSQLVNFTLWWHGPVWLLLEENMWPKIKGVQISAPEERKKDVTTFVAIVADTSMLSRYSSLNRLIRVTAYCRRFIHNCRPGDNKLSGYLSVDELQQALHVWIVQTQSSTFSSEIKSCVNKLPLPSKSRLLSLHPFLDSTGVLRVGGRLQEANIPYDQKHPVILPSHHPFTDLIITYEHLANLHAGPQLLLAILRRRYWILCARQVVRHHVFKCIKCFRHRVHTSQQLMGNLPSSRLLPGRPFLKCGVDYAGPITLRLAKGRGGVRSHKAYICAFVCFVVKAIHLELVNDLSTESFIAALHRFISRRGKPADIFSDCGTNFVGANRELCEMNKLFNSPGHNKVVSDMLSTRGIKWHFNPPAAPHFGGLWEAGVKSVKYHLRRVVGNAILTYEEMYTVLTQIEACLNSRPLCPITSDPSDLSVLTPGHFLIGDALTSFPEIDLVDFNMNRLSRWRLVQQSVQHFWRAWSSEFLSRLQQRPKWTSLVKNINIGDLVILKGENISPLNWPLARVVDIHPGKDNIVRVVTVKTATGSFKRPIAKCCVLPIEQ